MLLQGQCISLSVMLGCGPLFQYVIAGFALAECINIVKVNDKDLHRPQSTGYNSEHVRS
jgi:hypothetical protein